MHRTALTAVGILVGWAVLSPAQEPVRQPTEPTAAERLFALHVQPLLREKCLACHGTDPDEIQGGLDLRSRASLLRGGDAFGDKVLIPGRADDSYLYLAIQRALSDYEMPPKQADRLSQEQTWWIRDWINGDAPWPDEQRVAEIYEKYADGIPWPTSGGLNPEWTNRKYKPENLWAYQPLQRPRIPGAEDSETGDNPARVVDAARCVDAFIERQLDAVGLKPAPSANRRKLIRRATFDLWGLPPDPDDVEAFVNDARTDDEALADLIERLLDSPHYGEQWGRHWLDVVRYADSSGFANDWERPNAWRYRDYVIRAFNSDKPYDDFIREQIAGDEILAQMPPHSAAANAHDSAHDHPSSLLIAAGFLRMGPWEHTGMSVAKVTRQQFLDDITDCVGQVFLGHALQCCRCHDHKFDPIPTRDYYSIQAVFATTQFADIDAEWLPDENLAGMNDDRRYLRMRLHANQQLLDQLTAKKLENDLKWFQQRNLPYETREEAKRAKAPASDIPPANVLMTPDEFGQERIGRKWQVRFPWELDRYEPIAFTVYSGKTRPPTDAARRAQVPTDPEGDGELEATAILAGGGVFSPTEPVVPGVLSAVRDTDGRPLLQDGLPHDIHGRRLAFAAWIADPKNPLTARVMANRIWQYHFGRGIAGNPNNFGATGKKPTHSELLDWLASEFMDGGWSVKRMHRILMLSQTYRRSTTHSDPASLREKDPLDQRYAVFRPRRLTAEELRDSMLAVSGELNRQVGGIPARPDMNLEAALQPRMIMGTFAPSYVPDPKPEQRNRRTVYAMQLRGHRDPLLETLNQPGSERSCELRDTSTIAPQALTLLNSRESNDRALALAARVLQESDSAAAAIERVFQLAYGRSATDQEIGQALSHWTKMQDIQSKLEFAPFEPPTEIVRRANEENTGEPFEFTERLFAYEDYVPDLQPHETDARTRALADLCLAILNSNEFVYVY